MLQRLMRNLAAEGDYAQGVVRELPALLDYMTLRHSASGSASADERQCGIAVRLNNNISVYGSTPCKGDIEALTEWLAVQGSDHDTVFMTDRLGELWEPAKEFAVVGAGLLVATVSRESRDFVLWFRPEYIETLHGCAAPPELIEGEPPEDRLKTRERFEGVRATVRGRSRPWRASDWEAGLDLHVALLGVVLRCIEDAARERAQARAQELLLLTELDHRVKDTVANTQALVLQSSRSTRLLRGFTQSLDHRIYAMDKAHRLLTERRWEGVSIGDLLHAELDAHRRGLGRVALSGPDVVLTPKAALAMSLAFHELCMNAARYGSLSLPGGRVSIRWHMTETGGVDLSWQEADGPLVVPPQQRGFGSNLIEQALAMETGGHSTLKFGRGGVTCTVVLPMSSIVRIKSIPIDTCTLGTNADGRP
jgi:light-regulated signal transduction histidine kinase (bacteriophytochrome)